MSGPGLRRMKRHISEGDGDVTDDRLPGPSSLHELFSWASDCFGTIQRKPGTVQRLHALVRGGIQLCSHYSGKGTAESIFHQLEDVIRSSPGAPEHMSGRARAFEAVFSCDMSPVARKCLLGMQPLESRCQHVFGSLESCLDPDFARQLGLMEPPKSMCASDKEQQYQAMEDFLFQPGALQRAYHAGLKSFCYQHDCSCGIWDNVIRGAGELVVNVSGFSCTDFSMRRSGSMPKFAGQTMAALHKWKAELLSLEPDLVFWETSPLFPGDYFQNVPVINEKYQCLSLRMSPEMQGWPVQRLRQFGVWIHRSRVAFHGDETLQDFKDMFCNRKVVISGNVFFCAPDDYVLAHLLKKASARGHNFQTFVSLPDLKKNLAYMITPATMQRYMKYQNLFQEQVCSGYGSVNPDNVDHLDLSTSFICDLDQNYDFAKYGPLVPSIPTHSNLMSMQAQRTLVGTEVLGCMGSLSSLVHILLICSVNRTGKEI